MSGRKIIEGLQQAVAGNFARVTIEGQKWIRQTPLEAAAPSMLEALQDALDYIDNVAPPDLEAPVQANARAAIRLAKGESE